MAQGIVNLSKRDITRADILTAVLPRTFNGFAALAFSYNHNTTMAAHLSGSTPALLSHGLIPTRYLNLSVKANAE